jgi:hypothetical protein
MPGRKSNVVIPCAVKDVQQVSEHRSDHSDGGSDMHGIVDDYIKRRKKERKPLDFGEGLDDYFACFGDESSAGGLQLPKQDVDSNLSGCVDTEVGFDSQEDYDSKYEGDLYPKYDYDGGKDPYESDDMDCTEDDSDVNSDEDFDLGMKKKPYKKDGYGKPKNGYTDNPYPLAPKKCPLAKHTNLWYKVCQVLEKIMSWKPQYAMCRKQILNIKNRHSRKSQLVDDWLRLYTKADHKLGKTLKFLKPTDMKIRSWAQKFQDGKIDFGTAHEWTKEIHAAFVDIHKVLSVHMTLCKALLSLIKSQEEIEAFIGGMISSTYTKIIKQMEPAMQDLLYIIKHIHELDQYK